PPFLATLKLFLLLLPRPPSPTLFPYTTLFRSPCRSPRAPCPSWTRKKVWEYRAPGSIPRPSPSPPRRLTWRRGRLQPHLQPVSRDRKSTRLNSSHVKISYAVFCLKKKKQNNHH